MALAATVSVALIGARGHIVEVEVDLSSGLPGLTFTGLPDKSVSEARDRVRAALLNSGFKWPDKRITVALLPADLRKHGSMFDLAMAVALLAASDEPKVNARRRQAIRGVAWLAELGLDGRLRPVRGVLPAVLALRAAGLQSVVVSHANAREAALVGGIRVLAAESLAEIARWIDGGTSPRTASAGEPAATPALPDLSDVVGQPIARRALEVAAAGGHHLMFTGSPGAGKTMLAERLPSILPPLEDDAALEVTAIHSVAGLLSEQAGLIRQPPLQMPHHSATMAAMVGGGSPLPRPGAVSLAHRGVLVLDETAEFAPSVLDSLRQPLESGQVRLHRVGGTVEYPARFQLVMAMNPCPCGAPRDTDCTCSPTVRFRYQRRLSGPLLDRVDVRMLIDPVAKAELVGDLSPRESSAVVAERVSAARSAARDRWARFGWLTNAEVPGAVLRSKVWRPPPEAMKSLYAALDTGRISARGFDRSLRIAWTITDLAGRSTPDGYAVGEAVHLRTGRAPEIAA